MEIKCDNPKTRLFAVRVDCAGLRPVTGYLSIPKAVDDGALFPCRLETRGYDGNSCTHTAPRQVRDDEIVFNINAHGLKLAEFGATEADTKALRWDVRSYGNSYAFDAKQNADPEVAYFNGMVLRVKRALQYLKTVKGWNGKDLVASGASQGGLQTIWAAACGEGVTRADSGITWCCDMAMNNARVAKKASGDGWYVRWVPGVAYYDAVVWAKRIPKSCRTNITRAGLGDYCCPPMGLAKLWNYIPGENKSIRWTQGSEHGYVPPAYEGRDVDIRPMSCFKDGGRILFLGDSITPSSGYPKTICDYCVTRYPERSIEIEGVGVPGDGVRWCGGRLEEEIVSRRPDVLSVMFGMNDVEHFLPSWRKGSDAAAQRRVIDRVVAAFKLGHADLIRKVRSSLPDVQIVWMTPSPYDAFSEDGKHTADNHAGVNDALAEVAAYIKESATDFDYKVIDLNASMLSYLKNQDGKYGISKPDRTHPNELGHLYMAWQFLKQTEAPSVVSDMAFDCGTGRVLRQENVDVHDFTMSDGRVSFVALEKALPLPIDPNLVPFARDIGMINDLSREMISFKGLCNGRWSLLIDGERVLSASAEELSAGINLSLYDTPQMRQAESVRLLNEKRFGELDHFLGRFRLARWAIRRWSKVDPDDLVAVRKFRDAMPEEKRRDWRWGALKPYLDNWERRDKIRADIAERSKAIRMKAKPVEHRYELLLDNKLKGTKEN